MEVHGGDSCSGGRGVDFDTWNIFTSPYLKKEKKPKEQTENMTLDASAKILAKLKGWRQENAKCQAKPGRLAESSELPIQ